MPTTPQHLPELARLVDQVCMAAAQRQPLTIRAGGTKDFYGNAVDGNTGVAEQLDPRSYSGVIAYQPTELVITARAGTPLREIETLIAAQGQMFGFEPPHFGVGATFGGCIAAGLAGPRRAGMGPAAGAIRDFMLGARVLNGTGQIQQSGGTVMKNVAGYDVSRLLAGSMGTLGVLLEASVKLVPRPFSEDTRRLACDEVQARALLSRWARASLAVSASCWCEGQLVVRLSGAHSAVMHGIAVVGGEDLSAAEATAFWSGVREQTVDFFAQSFPLWRVSVPATADSLALGAPELQEWGGALRWVATTLPAATVRARAATLGGHATLFRNNPGGVVALTPLSAIQQSLESRVRAAFDPHGIFNSGRMHANAAC